MVVTIKETVAFNLKRLRKERGWNQEKLAEVTELSVATIQSLETERSWLGLETVSLLAEAFNIVETELFMDPSLLPRASTPGLREVIAVLATLNDSEIGTVFKTLPFNRLQNLGVKQDT